MIESAAATLYVLTSPAARTAATRETKKKHTCKELMCVINVKVLGTRATTCSRGPSLWASPGILGITAAAEVGKRVELV